MEQTAILILLILFLQMVQNIQPFIQDSILKASLSDYILSIMDLLNLLKKLQLKKNPLKSFSPKILIHLQREEHRQPFGKLFSNHANSDLLLKRLLGKSTSRQVNPGRMFGLSTRLGKHLPALSMLIIISSKFPLAKDSHTPSK